MNTQLTFSFIDSFEKSANELKGYPDDTPAQAAKRKAKKEKGSVKAGAAVGAAALGTVRGVRARSFLKGMNPGGKISLKGKGFVGGVAARGATKGALIGAGVGALRDSYKRSKMEKAAANEYPQDAGPEEKKYRTQKNVGKVGVGAGLLATGALTSSRIKGVGGNKFKRMAGSVMKDKASGLGATRSAAKNRRRVNTVWGKKARLGHKVLLAGTALSGVAAYRARRKEKAAARAGR